MNAYFSMDTPYLYRINDKMRKLISLISTEEIKHMIKKQIKIIELNGEKHFTRNFQKSKSL